jgi:Prokaryotic Cytochrome C oxidase subunit IV
MSHDEHDDKHFNPEKVFAILFALTVLEVLWGYTFGVWMLDPGEKANKLVLWGGLLFFAFYKGWLIALYFMHLKFEGWVVKSLILPTPFLIMVIFGYVMPDVADEETRMVHPIGSEVDPETGGVVEDMAQGWHPDHGGEAHSATAPAASGEKH